MGFLFGGKKSAPAPAPAVPAPDTSMADDLAQEETRNKILRKKLYGDTVLTGKGGDLIAEDDTKTKTLLGA